MMYLILSDFCKWRRFNAVRMISNLIILYYSSWIIIFFVFWKTSSTQLLLVLNQVDFIQEQAVRETQK